MSHLVKPSATSISNVAANCLAVPERTGVKSVWQIDTIPEAIACRRGEDKNSALKCVESC